MPKFVRSTNAARNSHVNVNAGCTCLTVLKRRLLSQGENHEHVISVPFIEQCHIYIFQMYIIYLGKLHVNTMIWKSTEMKKQKACGRWFSLLFELFAVVKWSGFFLNLKTLKLYQGVLRYEVLSVYISVMRYFVHYLHFWDYCPHFCRHVYHSILTVVRSGLLQVVGMSNLIIYFGYRGWLFKFHDVSYQLSPVNFPSESSPLPSPGIELTSLCMLLDPTNAFIHCTMCPWVK